MKFKYKAKTAEGKMVEGTATAESKTELFSTLRESDLTLLTAIQERDEGSLFARISHRIESMTGRIKEQDKIMFARNLGAMIKAGLPMSRALAVMERQTKKLKFKALMRDLAAEVQAGNSFHGALKKNHKVFSSLFIAMAEAGEESGNLAETLRDVSDHMERSYKLKKKIKGALMYPAVIIIAMIIIGILMMIYVVPTLTATFIDLNVDLPASTQFIISLSTFLSEYSFLALGIAIVVIGGIWWGVRTPEGKHIAEIITLKLPVVGTLVRESNSAQTASTLSSLLAAGVNVVESLKITGHVVQNSHYKKVLESAYARIQKGVTMSEVLQEHEDLYPPFVGEMVLVGEETGDLPGMLNEIAMFYQEDVQQKTQDLSTIIEPILMIVVGAAVGFFAVSMITPMYDLTSTL